MLSFRAHGPEVQAQNKRNLLQHNNSTQTDIFYTDRLEDRKEPSPSGGSSSFLHKPFPGGRFPVSPQACPSASERSLSSFRSDASGERGYGLVDVHTRQPLLPFETEVGPCGVPEPPLDKADPESSSSGGTWPKAGLSSTAGPEKLSVYKKPKQRKSIFDPNTFKRPQTPPRIDYLLPGPGPVHSPQPSKRAGPLTPPKPPRRSDSIKFQHRLETSSESEATLVGSSPSTSPPGVLPPAGDPGEPMHASPHRKARVRIASSYYPKGDGDSSCLPAKKSCDEDLTSQKMDELGQKRRRPKSAPSYRPKLAPVVIPAQFLEVEPSPGVWGGVEASGWGVDWENTPLCPDTSPGSCLPWLLCCLALGTYLREGLGQAGGCSRVQPSLGNSKVTWGVHVRGNDTKRGALLGVAFVLLTQQRALSLFNKTR